MSINNQKFLAIPSDWTVPKYSLGQWTKQGLIVGVEFYPSDTLLACQYGQKWRYSVLRHKLTEDTDYHQEDGLEPLSVQEMRSKILSEIKLYQSRITNLTERLEQIQE
ncbi:hypothetical protein ACE1AT_11100 [Pelatocladus sp. BLCC-F211]|uniref:hypothetical protein n=1 Tax=Pelatocladus sp. BLCC-F211 TaxID=3342752 RepID=UPI0035B90AD4